ncbi:MAG: hypothetical protein ACMXYF_01360 [Candidatus Woesearchaeota archaeon]
MRWVLLWFASIFILSTKSFANSIFEPLAMINPIELYEVAGPFIDFIVILLFFIAILKGNKAVSERLGNKAAITIGVMLAISITAAQGMYSIRLADLTPVALVIFFVALGAFLYRFFVAQGMRGAFAAFSTIIIVMLSLTSVFGPNLEGLQSMSPTLYDYVQLAFAIAIAGIILIPIFYLIGRYKPSAQSALDNYHPDNPSTTKADSQLEDLGSAEQEVNQAVENDAATSSNTDSETEKTARAVERVDDDLNSKKDRLLELLNKVEPGLTDEDSRELNALAKEIQDEDKLVKHLASLATRSAEQARKINEDLQKLTSIIDKELQSLEDSINPEKTDLVSAFNSISDKNQILKQRNADKQKLDRDFDTLHFEISQGTKETVPRGAQKLKEFAEKNNNQLKSKCERLLSLISDRKSLSSEISSLKGEISRGIAELKEKINKSS